MKQSAENEADAVVLPERWEFTQPPVAGTELYCPRCRRWSPVEEWDAASFARPLACAQWFLICPLCPSGADRVFGEFDFHEQPVPVRRALHSG
jgi:hypothetical protein